VHRKAKELLRGAVWSEKTGRVKHDPSSAEGQSKYLVVKAKGEQ
jgi:hypothetical protein